MGYEISILSERELFIKTQGAPACTGAVPHRPGPVLTQELKARVKASAGIRTEKAGVADVGTVQCETSAGSRSNTLLTGVKGRNDAK